MRNDIEEIATLSCSNCGSLLVGDTNIIIEYPQCDLCAKDKECPEVSALLYYSKGFMEKTCDTYFRRLE